MALKIKRKDVTTYSDLTGIESLHTNIANKPPFGVYN